MRELVLILENTLVHVKHLTSSRREEKGGGEEMQGNSCYVNNNSGVELYDTIQSRVD